MNISKIVIFLVLITCRISSLEKTNNNGFDLMRSAIITKDSKRVIDLIESGFNVNAKDQYNLTPLLWAVKASSDDIIKLLLKANEM